MSIARTTIDGPSGHLLASFSRGAVSGAVAVLLLHGINGSSADWDPIVGALAIDRPVLSLDYRGHGGSERSGGYGLEGYLADALAVATHFEVDHLHVVGTSFGGSVAIAMAVKYPWLVRSVTSIASALRIGDTHEASNAVAALRREGTQSFFERVIPRYSFPVGTSPSMIAQAIEVASSNDVETVAEIVASAFETDIAHLVADVAAPSIVITGSLDATCPPASGRALAEALGCAHVVLDGCGHLPSVEMPELLSVAIRAHLAEADSPCG